MYRDVAAEDSRIHWMFWPATDEPDLAAVKQAYEMGACGLKLHNHRIMKGEVPFDIWYSPEWQKIFALLVKLREKAQFKTVTYMLF